MECPRCNSRIPDNMKYCGFCGTELETGREKIIEYWIGYIRHVLQSYSNNQTDATPKIIASGTLGILSLVTLLGQYPFESVLSWMMTILSILGMIAGGKLFLLFLDHYQEISLLSKMYDDIHLGIVSGEITTSNEIMTFRGRLLKKLEKELKHVTRGKERYIGLVKD